MNLVNIILKIEFEVEVKCPTDEKKKSASSLSFCRDPNNGDWISNVQFFCSNTKFFKDQNTIKQNTFKLNELHGWLVGLCGRPEGPT